ncbi:MAG: hypothetical protein FJ034_06320 [Chloroflexi bacterium]|nr:hypothetical protein [Chloroflexota bacterium]
MNAALWAGLLGAVGVWLVTLPPRGGVPTDPVPTARAGTGALPPPPTPNYVSPLGFTLMLPTGWRRSDLQSTASVDVFTNRSLQFERESIAAGRGHELSVHIGPRPNPGGLDPAAFARQSPVPYERALFIADERAPVTWVVGWYVHTPGGEAPIEVARTVEGIIQSFRVR